MTVPRAAGATQWDLVLLMTADMEGQLESFPNRKGEIVGGLTKIGWAVAQIRSHFGNKTLLVSGGDDLAGPYYSQHGGGIIFEAMNLVGYDASVPGNHAFDHGSEYYAKSLETPTFPVLASNIYFKSDNPLQNYLRKNVLIERGGYKIGIFGLVIQELPLISKPGKGLAVREGYARIAVEQANTLRDQGADLVICLAHLGLEEAWDIVERVPGIDVVCVGSTADIVPKGRELVPRKNGKPGLVIQAGERGQYLGILKLDMEQGQIRKYHWQAEKMGAEIGEDKDILQLVASNPQPHKPKEILARFAVPVDVTKRTLRSGEAAIGSLVCDMLASQFKAEIALYNGGGIRGKKVFPAGPFTLGDLSIVFPFGDTAVLATVSGENLRRALERGVADLPKYKGQFMQVSGIRYKVNVKNKPQILHIDNGGKPKGIAWKGERITSVQVLQNGNWEPLNDTKLYNVVLSGFVASGGDGIFLPGSLEKVVRTGIPVKDVVEEQLRLHSVLTPSVDGRIVVEMP